MDNAGNYSKVVDNPSSFLQIKIDEVSPTVGNATLDFNDDSIYVTGVARDGEAGIDDANIWVLRNGVKYTLATAVEKLAGEYSNAGETWTVGAGDKYNKYKLTITASDVVSGKNEFAIVISDKAGNATESSKFTIDNEAPMITNKITGLGNVKDDEEFAFVKANFTTTADVNVTDTDKNKIATVTYKDTYIDASDVEQTLTSGNALKSGTTNKIEITTAPTASYENKQVTRTITTTNIFGQKTEWSYKLRFDTTNPVLSTSSVGDVSSSEVTNTWFNQNTLSLKGTYSETGSGVNKITYNLNGETGSIYTTVGTGANAGKEIFDSTLSGFKEGTTANILKFSAIDKATNISSEQTYNVKVDTTPAKIVTGIAPGAANGSPEKDLWYRLSGETVWKPYDAYILTDTTKAIELSGLYLDQNTTDETTKTYAQSGVKTIEIIVGSNKINATLSEDKLSGRWTATATNADLLSGISGTVTARIKVTDNAGT